MPHNREIKTCSRCRQLKVRCDRSKPGCLRCRQANIACSFQIAPSPPTNSNSTSPTEYSVRAPAPDAPSPITIPTPSLESRSESPTAESDKYDGSDNDLEHVATSSRSKIPKKRQRACLSCVRCHRLKVKCDKKQPCSRCQQSGFGRQCQYTHRIEPTPNQLEAGYSGMVTNDGNPKGVIDSWHCRPRGSSHWKALLTKIEVLANMVTPIFTTASEEIANGIVETAANLVLPINYPFNSHGAAKYGAFDAVWNLIHSHHKECVHFVDRYLHVFHSIHPIVNTTELQSRIDSFWIEASSDDPAWLAEFCMVLALGSFEATRDPEIAQEFCLAAEACLSKTAFMVLPSISTLRTMCLMIMAKEMGNGTCWVLDSCWTLMGFIVRQAACLGLHRKPAPFTSLKPHAYEEWQSGQTLWVTILYLCIQVSTASGMPAFLRADELLYSNDDFPWMMDSFGKTEQIWQVAIRTSAPLILEIVARVNSENNVPTYEETVEYTIQIRQMMSMLDDYQLDTPLRITLDLYFRRVLLVMHRRYALEADGPYTYPVSYWASLECSLAFLVHQREMSEGDAPDNSLYLITRFFISDFFAAALTACIHLLREDAPLADGSAIPPRQTILGTLEACMDLWGKEEGKSVCYRSGHRMLQSVLSILSP